MEISGSLRVNFVLHIQLAGHRQVSVSCPIALCLSCTLPVLAVDYMRPVLHNIVLRTRTHLSAMRLLVVTFLDYQYRHMPSTLSSRICTTSANFCSSNIDVYR